MVSLLSHRQGTDIPYPLFHCSSPRHRCLSALMLLFRMTRNGTKIRPYLGLIVYFKKIVTVFVLKLVTIWVDIGFVICYNVLINQAKLI